MKQRQTITTERVGVVCQLLFSGGSWPTRSVAAKLGVSQAGAYSMLAKLSRVLPLTLDEDGWRLVDWRE